MKLMAVLCKSVCVNGLQETRADQQDGASPLCGEGFCLLRQLPGNLTS